MNIKYTSRFERFLYNTCEIGECFIDKIRQAQKHIYIANWLFDPSEDEKELILSKCEEGVKVFVITFDNITYDIKKNIIKHENFQIKHVKYSHYNPLRRFIMKLESRFHLMFTNRKEKFQKDQLDCIYSMHQRYALIDDKCFILSGTDFFQNDSFYLHETAIQFNEPGKDIISFCKENFETDGDASIRSNYFFGNFKEFNTEFKAIKSIIENTEKFLFISQQYFNVYSNEIGGIIADLVKKKDEVRVVFVVESDFIDEPSFFYQGYFKSMLNLSMKFFKHKLTGKQLERLLICSVREVGGKPFFNHSKLIVSDHSKLILTSSNFHSNSFVENRERELGTLLIDGSVEMIERKLFEMFTGEKINDSGEIFRAINESKNIKILWNEFYPKKVLYSILYFFMFIT
ncbi:phosphatidylserine/phosphatidylglycerophosphate/cardiolipin synthase family protein [Spirochaetota bacterium]